MLLWEPFHARLAALARAIGDLLAIRSVICNSMHPPHVFVVSMTATAQGAQASPYPLTSVLAQLL